MSPTSASTSKTSHGPAQPRFHKPAGSAGEIEIDARTPWTGEPDRDAHPRSADFLDVEHYPTSTFRSREVKLLGDHDYFLRENAEISEAPLFTSSEAPPDLHAGHLIRC